MERVTITLADISINLSVHYQETIERFREFLNDKIGDIDYCVTNERIEAELLFLRHKSPNKGFSRADAEYNLLYRDLSDILWKEGALLYHGVLIEMDGKGYLFTSPSGIGKSTHANLWEKMFPGRARIINGDKPLLKLSDDGIIAYGTPWKGKENIGFNSRTKLKSIIHLHRGEQNIINDVTSSQESVVWLFEQVAMKSRDRNLLQVLDWFKRGLRYISLYELECNMQPDAARITYETVR